MKRLALVAWVLCGCMSTQKGIQHASTSAVQASVDSAAWAARHATRHTEAARASLEVAAAKSREWLTVASPSERPLALQVGAALETARTELDGARQQLAAAEGALAASSGELETLQKQVRVTSDELASAQTEANRLKAGRDFWRACAWKLALLSLALGVWTLRKPLLALAGL